MGFFRKFLEFVREQGVVSLAIAFILGGGITKLVTAFVTDIVDPVGGALFGAKENLREATFPINGTDVAWGDFVVTLVDFAIIVLLVFLAVKVLHLEKLDRRKT